MDSGVVGNNLMGIARVLEGPCRFKRAVFLEKVAGGGSVFPSLPDVLGKGGLSGGCVGEVVGQASAQGLARYVLERDLLLSARVLDGMGDVVDVGGRGRVMSGFLQIGACGTPSRGNGRQRRDPNE